MKKLFVERASSDQFHKRRPALKELQREFIASLERIGYAPCMLRHYGRATDLMVDAITRRKPGSAKVDDRLWRRLAGRIVETVPDWAASQTRYSIDSFRGFLTEAGLVMPPTEKIDHSRRGRLKRAYEAYLRDQRGLSETTVLQCLRFFERFFTFRFGEKLGDLNTVKSQDLVEFMLHLRRSRDIYRDKTPPTHLRSLFQFLFWAGETKSDLSASIPRAAQPKPGLIPRYLSPEEVDRLTQAVRTDSTVGRRDYAMLLLMARLGLRVPEVIAIQLADIDWRNGEIMIRGKGKRHDPMPLPTEVGEAIVAYIRNGRRGNSRTLFVSTKAPFEAFPDGQLVNFALKRAYAKTGLRPPQSYIGAQILRHSLATDMLRKGASLEEIGDVLRHRSRMSTTIYAQHDTDALRSLARSWPQGGAR